MSETLNAIFEMVRADRARGLTPRTTNAMRAEFCRRGLKTFSQGWLQGARSAAEPFSTGEHELMNPPFALGPYGPAAITEVAAVIPDGNLFATQPSYTGISK